MEIIKIGLIILGSVLSLEGLVLFIAYMYFKDNKEFLLKFIMDEGLYGLSENDKILIHDNVIMDTDGIGTIVIGSYELIKEI